MNSWVYIDYRHAFLIHKKKDGDYLIALIDLDWERKKWQDHSLLWLERKFTFTFVVSYWPKLIEFFWCKVPLGWKWCIYKDAFWFCGAPPATLLCSTCGWLSVALPCPTRLPAPPGCPPLLIVPSCELPGLRDFMCDEWIDELWLCRPLSVPPL